MSSKVEDRIREIAEALVEQSQAKADRLKAELIEAQQGVRKLTAELNAARLAPKHLQGFQIKRDADYQCPRCAIQRGIQAAMTCRPGQHRLDLFQCETCGLEIDVRH
jgi:transcription initiation factor IIE alpha subunit